MRQSILKKQMVNKRKKERWWVEGRGRKGAEREKERERETERERERDEGE